MIKETESVIFIKDELSNIKALYDKYMQEWEKALNKDIN